MWLGTLERKGITLVEIWAINVPTLVKRKDLHTDKLTGKKFVCSTAPFLPQEFGQDFSLSQLDINLISSFLTNFLTKSPRNYAITEFSTARYMENYRPC